MKVLANHNKLDRELERDAALFDQLIDMQRKCFERRNHSVAFHVLSAALHLAQEMGDETRLALVQRLATEELEWIDLNDPAYEHSSANAKLRGQIGIFANLARQAQTMARMTNSRLLFQYITENRADRRRLERGNG